MSDYLLQLFDDNNTVLKIQKRLPYLFQLAELESSRAGKIGMEVGSLREKIIVALLIYLFGEKNVETELAITEPELDVKLYGNPISIKTITDSKIRGIKLIWTVDALKSKEFLNSYQPKCDILLVQINWNNYGGFYYIPLSVQKSVFDKIGREKYIKLPKAGTNPRGIELTGEALDNLFKDQNSKSISIFWYRTEIFYNPYKRWIDLWMED
ncbi:MAG: hypothetical protein BWY18_00262 [Candidatus Cloacimonetes bacterium ADurb.Bin211]|mgnify:CR=1 FL=1|jgi:hypothetical protein|nr:MAG: hypothetical protein BWY18_00262 [Candidatus Cloacimonetes bacterium ADurb.Bin211]